MVLFVQMTKRSSHPSICLLVTLAACSSPIQNSPNATNHGSSATHSTSGDATPVGTQTPMSASGATTSASPAQGVSGTNNDASATPTPLKKACVGPNVQVDFLFGENKCCPGLSPLGALPPPLKNNRCMIPPPGPAMGICWPNCGNNRCESPNENHCNCPKDCP